MKIGTLKNKKELVMFGQFGKKSKEEALDEDTILAAGITAGTAFRLTEKKFGFTPVDETPALIERCKQTACQMLSISPDEQSRTVMHMVTLVFAMDESGLAEKITNRYEQGDKRFNSDEAQKIWALTLQKSNEVANHYSNNGKR